MCDQESVLKVLDCPVCLRAFNQPRLLPCGHTLCVQCVAPLVRGSKLSCPECRKVHKVPPGGVERFPPNPVVISLLDTLCKGCRKVKPEADCDHCGQRLCQGCIAGHHGYEELTTLLGSLDIAIRQASDVVATVEPLQKSIPVMQELDKVSLLMHQEVDQQIHTLKNFVQAKIMKDLDGHSAWSNNVLAKISRARSYYETAMSMLGEEYSNAVEDYQMDEIKSRSQTLQEEIHTMGAHVPSTAKIRLKFNANNMFQLSKFALMELEVDEPGSGGGEHTGADEVETIGAEAARAPEKDRSGSSSDGKKLPEAEYHSKKTGSVGANVSVRNQKSDLTKPFADDEYYVLVRLVTEDEMFNHPGHDLFDPMNAELRTFFVNRTRLLPDLLTLVSEIMKFPVSQLRLWPFSVRSNQSLRPFLMDFQKPIMMDDLCVENDPVYIFVEIIHSITKLPMFDANGDVLLFLKRYDPKMRHMSYCGHVYMPITASIKNFLLPVMRERSGFPADMPLLLFEEVSHKRTDRIREKLGRAVEKILDELMDGDIIVFQADEDLSHYEIPTAKEYFRLM